MIMFQMIGLFLLAVWIHSVEAAITTPVTCYLNLTQTSLPSEIEERLSESETLRLVRYRFNVKNDTGPFSSDKADDLFLIKTYSLVLAIDDAAKTFLHLKEYFVEMSLYTLQFSVADFQLDIVQSPMNCLENVSATDLETELKLMILRNFGASRSTAIGLEGEVCSQYLKVIDDKFGFATYNCCRLDTEGNFLCNDLENIESRDIIFVAIVIVQVLCILYSPNLVRIFLVQEEAVKKHIYKHKLEDETKKKLIVKRIDHDDKKPDGFVKTKLFSLRAKSNLKELITILETNEAYSIDIEIVHLVVEDIRVVAGDVPPITVFGFLRSLFIRCDRMKGCVSDMKADDSAKSHVISKIDEHFQTSQNIYEELTDLESCCNASLCQNCCNARNCPSCCNAGACQSCYKRCICICKLRWYQILSLLMKIIRSFVVTLPWWFRVWFYYNVEEGILAQRQRILDKMGLNQPWQGSIVLALTPLHPFFISMYILIILTIVVIMMFFREDDTKFDVQSTLIKLISNTKHEKKFSAFLNFLAILLMPMKQCGLIGIILIPMWLIAILILGLLLLCVNIFPILNFTIRLFLLSICKCNCSRVKEIITLCIKSLRYKCCYMIKCSKYVIKCIMLFLFCFRYCYKSTCYKCYKSICNKSTCICYIMHRVKKYCSMIIDTAADWVKMGESEHMRSETKNKYALALFTYLLYIVFLIIFIVESLIFYAECIIFMVIGIILNSGDTYIYLVLFLSISIYAYRCFSSVGSRYKAFAKKLNEIIFEKVKEKVIEEAKKKKADQRESAFVVPQPQQPQIEGVDRDTCNRLELVPTPILKWNAKRLLLFLNTDDIIHISREFLMKIANINHAFCPKPVHILYLRALIKLVWITLYLTFQFIVIAAFGRATNSSSLTQTLAVSAGGFLPYILKKYITKKDIIRKTEKNNLFDLALKYQIDEQIEKHEECWPLAGLSPSILRSMGPNIRNNEIDLIARKQQDGEWEFWVRNSNKCVTSDTEKSSKKSSAHDGRKVPLNSPMQSTVYVREPMIHLPRPTLPNNKLATQKPTNSK